MQYYSNVSKITTADGSNTLVDNETNATYRSKFGAFSETKHVFIDGSRLSELLGKQELITVVELGFGAGINFSNTAKLCQSSGVSLDYYAIDNKIIDPELMPDNGWPTEIAKNCVKTFKPICTHQTIKSTDHNVSLTLYNQNWHSIQPSIFKADCFYHDPFSPTLNPDCWTEEAFIWGYSQLKNNCWLATYSAASKVKKNIQKAGFKLEVRKGIPPKREVLAALKTDNL